VDDRSEIGAAGERAAAAFLQRRRIVIVERNYSCRGGEIDLVAVAAGTLVFVEVRTRSAGSLVDPLASIDGNKRRRIVTAARHYVARHGFHDRPMRFDVVSVRACGGRLECQHLENAFDLDDLPPPRRRW